MAKKNTHQLPLNPAEKMRLQEAYNLMVYGSENNNKIMVQAGEMTWAVTEGDPQKAEAFAEFQKTLTLDEDFKPHRFDEQYGFIQKRFYSTTSAGGGSVLFIRRHQAQKADEMINREAGKDTLNNRFGAELLIVFQLFWYSFTPSTVSREYLPTGEALIFDDYAYYANTWVPPTIKPNKNNKPTARPEFWQQYLDRLMPKQHICWWMDNQTKVTALQQDYFEAWLVTKICYPTEKCNVGVVLRGNFGTGKGFWLDTIAQELVGTPNYQPVTTKAWKGDFNGDLFDSVIIHLEETNDTRANTSEMLKMLTTQDRHRANVKNLPQKFVQKYFALAISSNHKNPIKIEKYDRRYFVPVWSDHLTGSEGRHETQAFFSDFYQWLTVSGGFQELRDWFEQVDVSKYDFMGAPYTQDKTDISVDEAPSESRKDQLVMWLISKEDEKLLFTTAALLKVNFKMTDVDVQDSLKQAGYVSQKRSFQGLGTKNLWIPSKHKDLKNLATKGWTIWNGTDFRIDVPDEDTEVHFSTEELEIKANLDAGKTVVINEYRHPNLHEFSRQKGILVNIMRKTSGGTIYGNQSFPNDKSDEERDRVCNEFETRQLPYISDDDILYLKGKVLMCRCKPKRCHGDSLAKAANDFVD